MFPLFLVKGGLTLDEGIYIAQMVAETGLFTLNNNFKCKFKQKCTYVDSFFLTLLACLFFLSRLTQSFYNSNF